MEFDLRAYFRILRKRLVWAVAAFVAIVAAGAYVTVRATPVYEANAKLLIGIPQVSQNDLSQGTAILLLSRQLQDTYAEFIRSRPVMERAVEADNLPISPSALAGGLRAKPIPNTQLIDLAYVSADPDLAQRAVNAVAKAFSEELAAFDPPAAEDPTQKALREEVNRFRRDKNQPEIPAPAIRPEPAVTLSIIEPALRPGAPFAPKPAQNMYIAIVLGLLAGLALAFLVEHLDVTVKDRQDMERVTGLPLLAAVPRINTEGRHVYLEREAQSAAAEAFRKLRTALQFLAVDHPIKVLLVSSPFAQEGKTMTSINLAASFAQAGLTTILVEADLRRPSLHHLFPASGQQGLTTALIGRLPTAQAIFPTGIRNLSYIPAGALPPNPVELLASDQMRLLLDELKTRADIVVVDAPPLLPVADASALASRVDGVIVVAKAGKTKRERLAETVELVRKVGGRPLGGVLNYSGDAGSVESYSYYGYRSTGSGAFEAERESMPTKSAEPTSTN